jgi:hypothetical protein
MILRPGDKAGILPAVRNVGDAVPQGADSDPVHAAERLGICDSGSDKARIGRHARIRWRTRAASIRFHSAIVTPVWNTSITKSTDAEACARRGIATKSAGGGRNNAETGARPSTPTRASYARAPRKGRIS